MDTLLAVNEEPNAADSQTHAVGEFLNRRSACWQSLGRINARLAEVPANSGPKSVWGKRGVFSPTLRSSGGNCRKSVSRGELLVPGCPAMAAGQRLFGSAERFNQEDSHS